MPKGVHMILSANIHYLPIESQDNPQGEESHPILQMIQTEILTVYASAPALWIQGSSTYTPSHCHVLGSVAQ